MKGWTFGAELEYGDLNRGKVLPKGCKWDERDYTMVNSNGVAVDPTGRSYPFGGEINTRPTDSVGDQVQLFTDIMKRYPEAACNYRSNLHIHIRVPGLRDDLASLKRIQSYIDTELRWYIDTLEPIPEPSAEDYVTEEELVGARKRYNRRRISHHTFIPSMRVVKQMQAKTLDEFLEAEVPRTKEDNKPMWHAQPRACVNLRQLRETDTIEFRHFPGTLRWMEFSCALVWCERFLEAALGDQPKLVELGTELTEVITGLPQFQPYVHWMELRYKATVHDGTWKPAQIKEHMDYILKGDCA